MIRQLLVLLLLLLSLSGPLEIWQVYIMVSAIIASFMHVADIFLILARLPSELVCTIFGGGQKPKPSSRVAVIDVVFGSGSRDH